MALSIPDPSEATRNALCSVLRDKYDSIYNDIYGAKSAIQSATDALTNDLSNGGYSPVDDINNAVGELANTPVPDIAGTDAVSNTKNMLDNCPYLNGGPFATVANLLSSMEDYLRSWIGSNVFPDFPEFGYAGSFDALQRYMDAQNLRAKFMELGDIVSCLDAFCGTPIASSIIADTAALSDDMSLDADYNLNYSSVMGDAGIFGSDAAGVLAAIGGVAAYNNKIDTASSSATTSAIGVDVQANPPAQWMGAKVFKSPVVTGSMILNLKSLVATTNLTVLVESATLTQSPLRMTSSINIVTTVSDASLYLILGNGYNPFSVSSIIFPTAPPW